MGRFVKSRILDSGALTVQIPDITTDQRPSGVDGDIIFNKTTQTFQGYIGSQWYNISSAAGEKTLTTDKFQGDGSTTVFGAGSGNTLDGSTAATLSVIPGASTDILVFVGGVYQTPETNYTVSGGQITFGSPPPANDGVTNGHIITVVHNLHKLGE